MLSVKAIFQITSYGCPEKTLIIALGTKSMKFLIILKRTLNIMQIPRAATYFGIVGNKHRP